MTCLNTFAPLYIASVSREASAVAALAEERKVAEYMCLGPLHIFTLIAFKTTSVFGPLTRIFIRDLARRLHLVTGEEKSHSHLIQRVWQFRVAILLQFWELLGTDFVLCAVCVVCFCTFFHTVF